MGAIPLQETHDPRPTGKLFAAKWKHEHVRMIIISAILSFAVTILIISSQRGVPAMSVTVVDRGISMSYETRSTDVSELLQERSIEVGPFDQLSLPLTAPISDGSSIVIDRANEITVQADGRQLVKYTTEKTVGNALKAFNLTLNSGDKLSPSLDTPLHERSRITVVRVRTETLESQHPIAYTVVEKKDANLAEGSKKVVTNGKEGVLVKTTKRVYEDGKLVSEQLVGKAVAQPAVQKVVAIGTKKKKPVIKAVYTGRPTADEATTVQLNGKTLNVRRLLKNVTLTAYSAGLASTGKSKGDSGYGVTSSGTTVNEGRTIAVDPRVIPMGWWVYIEGIGFRRAEDTGSAVKGKKIDIYYDSEKYADSFGMKRGYTVYVIGPNKPSSD